MSKVWLIILIVLMLIGLGVGEIYFLEKFNQTKIIDNKGRESQKQKPFTKMTITSDVFKNNEKIPAKNTCDGEDINPPLEFGNISEGAQSLALVVDDPDAPGGTWIHWTVWNIDPQIPLIRSGEVPPNSTEGLTSNGRIGYHGPCPPSGVHHYRFMIYALDMRLDWLLAGASIDDLRKEIDNHVIDSAELVGIYSRE